MNWEGGKAGCGRNGGWVDGGVMMMRVWLENEDEKNWLEK